MDNCRYSDNVRILYNQYGYYHGGMAGSVFDTKGVAPTITTMEGGVDNR